MKPHQGLFLQRVCLLVASGLFLTSLFLPAVTLQSFDSAPVRGWAAALIGVIFWPFELIFWPANLVMVATVLISILPAKDFRVWVGRWKVAVTAVLLLSTLGALSLLLFSELQEYHSGYWCWVASLSLTTAVFFLSSPAETPSRVEPQPASFDTPEPKQQ